MLLSEDIDSEDEEDEDFEPINQIEDDENLFLNSEFDQILPQEISNLIAETESLSQQTSPTITQKTELTKGKEDFDSNDSVYKKFLQSFDPTLELDFDEEDDDSDYTFSEDERVPEPVQEIEEYRKDHGVKVSSQELTSLFVPKYKFPIPSTRRGKKFKPKVIKSFQPIKPLVPAMDDKETNVIPLTEDIHKTIEKQIKIHLQLLLQVYSVLKKDYLLNSKSKYELDEQRKLIIEIQERRKHALFWKSFRASFDEESKRMTRSQKKFPLNVNLMLNVHSVFDFQGFELVDNFMETMKQLDKQVVNSEKYFEIVFKPFLDKKYFDKELLKIDTEKKKNVTFTNAEDSLLALGLEKYGTTRWASIKINVLPTKSEKQLINRYKNMCQRGSSNNPIKLWMSTKKFMKKSLSENEEVLLRRGIALYGNEFELISTNLLPERPPSFLKKAWLELNDNNIQKESNNVVIIPPIPQNFFKESKELNQNLTTFPNTMQSRPQNFKLALSRNPVIQQIKPIQQTIQTKQNLSILDVPDISLPDFSNQSIDWSQIGNSKNGEISFDYEDIDSDEDDSNHEVLHPFDVENVEKYSLLDSLQKSLEPPLSSSQIEFETEDIDSSSDEEIEDSQCIPWTESEDRLILRMWSKGKNKTEDWKSVIESKELNRSLNEVKERYQMLKKVGYETSFESINSCQSGEKIGQ
eukprot:gene209-4455_t